MDICHSVSILWHFSQNDQYLKSVLIYGLNQNLIRNRTVYRSCSYSSKNNAKRLKQSRMESIYANFFIVFWHNFWFDWPNLAKFVRRTKIFSLKITDCPCKTHETCPWKIHVRRTIVRERRKTQKFIKWKINMVLFFILLIFSKIIND